MAGVGIGWMARHGRLVGATMALVLVATLVPRALASVDEVPVATPAEHPVEQAAGGDEAAPAEQAEATHDDGDDTVAKVTEARDQAAATRDPWALDHHLAQTQANAAVDQAQAQVDQAQQLLTQMSGTGGSTADAQKSRTAAETQLADAQETLRHAAQAAQTLNATTGCGSAGCSPATEGAGGQAGHQQGQDSILCAGGSWDEAYADYWSSWVGPRTAEQLREVPRWQLEAAQEHMRRALENTREPVTQRRLRDAQEKVEKALEELGPAEPAPDESLPWKREQSETQPEAAAGPVQAAPDTAPEAPAASGNNDEWWERAREALQAPPELAATGLLASGTTRQVDLAETALPATGDVATVAAAVTPHMGQLAKIGVAGIIIFALYRVLKVITAPFFGPFALLWALSP